MDPIGAYLLVSHAWGHPLAPWGTTNGKPVPEPIATDSTGNTDMDLIAGLGLAIGVDAVNEQTNERSAPRELDGHKVNPANDRLLVLAKDEPGSGGANHHYEISGFDGDGIPAGSGYMPIHFQNGPIGEVGVNGVTEATLLVILIDRLTAFQAGPYASDYNGAALAHLQSALGALHDRTRARMARNVEGTNTP